MKRTLFIIVSSFVPALCLLVLTCFPTLQSFLRVIRRLWLPSQLCSFVFLLNPHAATHAWRKYKIPLFFIHAFFFPPTTSLFRFYQKTESYGLKIFRCWTQNVLWFFICLSFLYQKLQGTPPCGNDAGRSYVLATSVSESYI